MSIDKACGWEIHIWSRELGRASLLGNWNFTFAGPFNEDQKIRLDPCGILFFSFLPYKGCCCCCCLPLFFIGKLTWAFSHNTFGARRDDKRSDRTGLRGRDFYDPWWVVEKLIKGSKMKKMYRKTGETRVYDRHMVELKTPVVVVKGKIYGKRRRGIYNYSF